MFWFSRLFYIHGNTLYLTYTPKRLGYQNTHEHIASPTACRSTGNGLFGKKSAFSRVGDKRIHENKENIDLYFNKLIL